MEIAVVDIHVRTVSKRTDHSDAIIRTRQGQDTILILEDHGRLGLCCSKVNHQLEFSCTTFASECSVRSAVQQTFSDVHEWVAWVVHSQPHLRVQHTSSCGLIPRYEMVRRNTCTFSVSSLIRPAASNALKAGMNFPPQKPKYT